MQGEIDHFTPSPKAKRLARDAAARRRDHSGSCDDTLERPIRRLQLLQRLALDMEEEENTAEKLFRTFDLSLGDASVAPKAEGTPDDLAAEMSTLFCSTDLADTGAACSGLSPSRCACEEARLNTPATEKRNSYLSTPMRMQYFPTLSPTILKMLLRTPPDYSPSASWGDRSNTTDHHVSPVKPKEEPSSTGERDDPFWTSEDCTVPASASQGQWLSTEMTGMPLTPPPSARLPGSRRFSGAAQDKVPERGLYVKDSQHDSPAVVPAIVHTAASSPGRLCPSSSVTLDDERAVQYPLLSPTTLRHFLYVIDELKSLHGDPDERQQLLRQHLRTSTSAPAELSSSPICPNSTPGRKTHRSRSPLIPPDLQHESALNQEFAALLLAQAIEEEQQAGELRKIADRLDRVALTRRRLAGVTIAKTAGMNGRPKRE
ncbi:hypothetical protein GLOTRDRAFT_136404 [Gloeophyllum trabeum ATCC 11539]|uniref:Uncharacterized protein n=1 Tax=Gloeophyllum trabeum (strain ATCC 11539 / FP-39264 / Madison 617) TaxID=670483 RepID=S7QK09_GLOTA|nr:uncharacterized protein GLOTRDRAFT_136404 [Gloeophyllum trabeum ATCC 11539]EPQ59558.1 hypothetical protein GLOTRDRAFT_136404 [Gloeophyllum trabeum ATCC 11539]